MALAADDVLKLQTPLGACLSLDGAQVACSVGGVSPERGVDCATIWLFDVASGEGRPLTDGSGIDSSPQWLPGTSSIVYLSRRDGRLAARLHGVDSGSDHELPAPEYGLGAVAPAPSPDGRQLAYAARVGPPRDPAAPYRVSSLFWRLDGVGLVDDAVCALFVMPLDGGAPRQLSDASELILSIQWSPDGTRVLTLSISGRDEVSFVARIYDAQTGAATEWWRSRFWAFPPALAWLTDGRIVRTTENMTVGLGEPTTLVTASSEDPHDLGRPLEGLPLWPFGAIQGDYPWEALMTPRIVVRPDGQEAYFCAHAHGRMELWATPLVEGARARSLSAGDEVVIPLDASTTDVLVARTTMHEPPELWLISSDGSDQRRLTHFNRSLFSEQRYFRVTPLSVAATDGEPINAWFLSPRDAAAPMPTIVNNHGGPHAAWGHNFSFDNCLIADAGYGILLVNPRGSTGTTPEFAQAIHGRWGESESDDVLRALDAAVEAGLADPEAVGIWGISFGAYLTARLITRSDRFKAAIVESPCVELTAMMSSDIGWLMASWFGARVGDGPEAMTRLAAQAPVTDAARCRTPTLIIQHERDLRTPPANADALFVALRTGGCHAEMLRIPTTPHAGSIELGEPRARVAQNEALLEWFGRYVPAAVAGAGGLVAR
jgi:dipeptidyl aminopeptidase/acylaminoacyl peptidase